MWDDDVGDGVCVSLYVACGVWVATWMTLCWGWCDGDDVWITLRGKHYVADAVQMTLVRG